MARNRWIQTTSTKIALAAATAKSVLVLTAPANLREAITGVSVSFDGTSNTAQPVLVELLRTSDAGTSTARNPVALESDIQTLLQITGGEDASAEPTPDKLVGMWLVHPQAGIPLPIMLPEGEVIVPGGGFLALRLTAPANVNCVAEIKGEE